MNTIISTNYHSINNGSIAEIYKNTLNKNSDIQEHLPVLYKYAQIVNSIVELGCRTGNSTIAFLNGLKKDGWMKSYDNWSEGNENRIFNPPIEILIKEKIAKEEGLNFKIITANDLEIEIPECDLLFIDTEHNGNQIYKELILHANKIKKYIIMHDTVTFGLFPENKNEINRGMMFGIIPFLINHKEWHVKEHYLNCNGLLILEK